MGFKDNIGEYSKIAIRVARLAQVSMLLEVSAYPKPGNVHRLRNFKETRYEHFLVSSSVAIEYFRRTAFRGLGVSLGFLDYEDIGIGGLIEECMRDVINSQNGGNTCLGTITLLIPICAASSMAMAKKEDMIDGLRHALSKILKSTTSYDAVSFYRAVRIAKPGGIGRSEWLDVYDDDSLEIIEKENISLYKIFKYSSSYDSIAYEWATDFKISFEKGSPYLYRLLREGCDINTAIVHTFLKILSEVPDTLIIRKTDRETAVKVSRMAREVLDSGGLTSDKGKRLLEKMDEKLRIHGNLLNPGTTADLTASSIMLVLLRGVKF